jgi:uncharacterized membrane protein
MLLLAIALALAAALLHAVWNVALKTSADPLWVSQRALASAAIITTPVAAVAWLLAGQPHMPAEAWLLAALSGIAELAYFIFLSAAYRRGELSSVYPVARGSAPLLAVLAGIAILGERPGALQMAGIVLLLVGIWVVRPPIRPGPALVPALLTGIAIATYTAIDKVGTGLAPPWLYGWAIWVVTAILLSIWVRLGGWDHISYRLRLSRVIPLHSEDKPPTLLLAVPIGLAMTVTYLMILFALRLAPLVVIAPLRESAIVLVTLWGVWRLRERERSWPKLVGAAGIAAGVILVAIQ